MKVPCKKQQMGCVLDKGNRDLKCDRSKLDKTHEAKRSSSATSEINGESSDVLGSMAGTSWPTSLPSLAVII